MSQPSLLAAVHDVLATPPTSDERVHPSSNSYSKTAARLNAILNTTSQLSHGLTQLSAMTPSDQTSKLVSLMKQHTAISASIALSRAATTALSSADRRAVFPDASLPSPSRLAEWGRAEGMEAFIDNSGVLATTTVVLAGKVLVLDIDVDGGVVVKTSFAVGNNVSSGTSSAPDLDAFLAREIARWADAARRALTAAVSTPDAEDPSVEAARYGRAIQEHLRYLMMLDSLAVTEGERGIRWFMEPVNAAQHFFRTPNLAAGSKSQPLDKTLSQRALPITYLNTPSLSFLVWLSPLAYLRLLRSLPIEQPSTTSGSTDIPMLHLTSSLSEKSGGATIASLKLIPSSDAFGVPSLSDAQNDYIFPDTPSRTWVLDFNRPSTAQSFPANSGVVMSQNRMRAIQNVIGAGIDADMLMSLGTPRGASVSASLGNMGTFGSIASLPGMGMGQLGFNSFSMGSTQSQSMGISGGGVGGSWVDLLLNEGTSSDYYKATCTSPSGAHPPLNLRLTAPQEPGFLLQRVPVKSASQVSRILNIVREQCWLNELLGMLQWTPDGVAPPSQGPISSTAESAPPSGEGSVSEELLASVLAGTISPHSIPVSVYLPSTSLPSLAQTNPNMSHFGLGGLGVGPPPVSGGSSSGSLFGSTDMEMEMEIPGLSMSMNSGIDITMAGMGMELTSSPVPSHPPPMIILSSPARAPAAGLVELRVSFEVNNGSGGTGTESGVKVESLPGVDTRGMDEVVRRGGIWGLPGRIWAARGFK
ncbi:hypothetical protein HYDPIDRAFT_37449 [Hydnomerulius pinastri MD-312]|nr:hypothetical protein HYDPIDRAFT_37449 [Hydnomerulius pinastri MD-312]